jgi:hypothetical protein
MTSGPLSALFRIAEQYLPASRRKAMWASCESRIATRIKILDDMVVNIQRHAKPSSQLAKANYYYERG